MGTVGEWVKGSVRRSEHETEYEKDGQKDCCERQGQQQALLKRAVPMTLTLQFHT